MLSPAGTQLDCVSEDVEPDVQQLQDGKQPSNFLSDSDGCTPKIADSGPDVATAIPIALSPGLWATAAEFVPGQPWKGLGMTAVFAFTVVVVNSICKANSQLKTRSGLIIR